MNAQIVKFTGHEFGQWHTWRYGDFKDFIIPGPMHWYSSFKRPASIRINGVVIHAVRLSDGRTWDCFNGFRSFR